MNNNNKVILMNLKFNKRKCKFSLNYYTKLYKFFPLPFTFLFSHHMPLFLGTTLFHSSKCLISS